MGFSDAFDNAKPAPKYEPLPAGTYQARIVSGSLTNTRNGDDAYRMTFEISEGECKGRRVFRTWTFSLKAVDYTKRDLAQFKLTTSKELLEIFPPLGKEVSVKLLVALQRGNDGSVLNDIKRIDDIRFTDSPASGFLIDPDGSEGGLK